jgi:pyruvate dehydrogenase E1 component alpha subunit
MFVKLHRRLRKAVKRVLARDGLWAQVAPDPSYSPPDRMQTPAPPTPPGGALPDGADDASLDPAHAGAVSDELAVALYEHMVLARELDGRLVALQREGRIVSYASSAGEEAAIVGAAAALRDEDWVFLGSREMAAALWRGMPLSACAHHLFGAASSAGKGRNLHAPPFWKPTRVVSVSPLSGTQIPHAVGVAWAARMRKDDVAALVFFGEGATSSGDFHTGLNFAGVTRAPVLAVCRNNGWATSLPASRQTASDGFAMKAVAYGLHGVRVDGADVAAVLGVVREARARASAGEGGTLIEAVTSPRREDESDEAWAHRDPIARTRRYLEGRGLSSAERDRGLFAEVHADVDRALADAASAPVPADASLFDDVYAVEPWHLREQRTQAAAAMAGRTERLAAEGGTNP